MDKKRKPVKHLRLWVQVIVAAVTNGYLIGFVKGKIFTGWTKQLCVPGLNCYSCPGALGSCPIGSLQAVLGSRNYKFAFYVTGFLMVVGAVFGRFVCGWLCPFGLVQDLLYKIPFSKTAQASWRQVAEILKIRYFDRICYPSAVICRRYCRAGFSVVL